MFDDDHIDHYDKLTYIAQYIDNSQEYKSVFVWAFSNSRIGVITQLTLFFLLSNMHEVIYAAYLFFMWGYVVVCLWYLRVLYIFPWVRGAPCTMMTESICICAIMKLDEVFSSLRFWLWLDHASCSMCFYLGRIRIDTKTDMYIAFSLM